MLESGLGRYFSFELGYDQAMLMFQPVGGMDRIPYALAKAVERGRGEIVHRHPGAGDRQHARRRARDVEHRGRPRVLEADYCVCTIPPTRAAQRPDQLLRRHEDGDRRAGRRRHGQDRARSTSGASGRRTTGSSAASRTPTSDLGTVWYPSTGFFGRKGVVVGYYHFGGDAVTYGDLPHAEREARAIAHGRKIHGDAYADELERSFSVAWHKIPYTEGGWVSWPTRTAGYQQLLQADGNTYFAGDHLSYFIAWQAGAIDSARLAVTALHERALATT